MIPNLWPLFYTRSCSLFQLVVGLFLWQMEKRHYQCLYSGSQCCFMCLHFEMITMKGLMGTKMMWSEVVSFRRNLNVKWSPMLFSCMEGKSDRKGTARCSNCVHWERHWRGNWQVKGHSHFGKKLGNIDQNDNIYMQYKSNRNKWKWNHCSLFKLRLIKDFITIVNMFWYDFTS